MMTEVQKYIHTECPACGAHHDMVSGIKVSEVDKPEPGDVTVCYECGAISLFDIDLAAVLVPEKVLEEPSFDTAKLDRAEVRKQRGLKVIR